MKHSGMLMIKSVTQNFYLDALFHKFTHYSEIVVYNSGCSTADFSL